MAKAHHSSLDPRFAQAEASRCLHDLLHLTRTNRDVADWLFCDCPEEDRTDGILPPETFKRSTAISTLQSYTDLAVPLQPPQKGNISEYSEDFIHELYVPVKECNGIALGYSFHSALPRRGSSIINLDIFPGMKTNRGRYAYKKDAKLLLVFLSNVTKTDVLLHIQWITESRRAVHYFAVPHRQYSYENRPEVVLLHGRSEADFLCRPSPRKQQREQGTAAPIETGEEALPSPAEFVDGDWREDNIGSLPECMFQDLHIRESDARYRESSAWLKERQVRALTGRYSRGLIQFQKRRKRFREGGDTPFALLDGTFFSAHVVRDVFDAAGGLAVRKAFEARTTAAASEPGCVEVLRRAASQLYYSVVLWASTDQCLVAAQEHSAAELLWGKAEERDR